MARFWDVAQKFQSAQGVGGENLSLLVSQVSPVHACRREECRAGATTQVARLQVALPKLGTEDLAEKAALEASLQKAQLQVTVPPVAEQVKETTQFIERAKRRLSSASECVQWAQVWLLNVRHSWPRLKNVWCAFEAEEVHTMEEVVVTDWEAESKALRQQIVELEGQRKSSG